MIDPNNASQTAVALSGDVVPTHGFLSWAATGLALYGAVILAYGLVGLLTLRLLRELRDLSDKAKELVHLTDEVRDEIRAMRRRES